MNTECTYATLNNGISNEISSFRLLVLSVRETWMEDDESFKIQLKYWKMEKIRYAQMKYRKIR